jgi:hypothetical protein
MNRRNYEIYWKCVYIPKEICEEESVLNTSIKQQILFLELDSELFSEIIDMLCHWYCIF